MYKLITDVVLGDIILEGNTRTTVTSIDKKSCMHKVHINDKDCYESFTTVRVQD